jgi:hypothetical protein
MLPEQRRLALAAAGVVAAAICAPMLVLGAPVTTDTVAVARTSGAIFQPWQLWWFLGEHGHRVMGLTAEKVGYRTPPAWVTTINHPLVVLVPVACALLVARRRRTLGAADGFALLALCFQLRCLLDTWNNVYYALPACLALVAWEVHAGRLPLVAFATAGMTWITFELLPDVASPDLQAAAYLAFALPLVGALALVSAQATTWSSFESPETTSAPSSVTITRSSIRTPTAPGT